MVECRQLLLELIVISDEPVNEVLPLAIEGLLEDFGDASVQVLLVLKLPEHLDGFVCEQLLLDELVLLGEVLAVV